MTSKPTLFAAVEQTTRPFAPMIESPAIQGASAVASPRNRPQLSDEVVAAVSAGIGRIQDHIGACVADGIRIGLYREVNARDVADLAWSVLLGSLDAAEMHTNLGLSQEALAARSDRALLLIESALTPMMPDALRAVA